MKGCVGTFGICQEVSARASPPSAPAGHLPRIEQGKTCPFGAEGLGARRVSDSVWKTAAMLGAMWLSQTGSSQLARMALGFLWAPLLAEPRILRKTIFRRLVPLPNLVIALLAATMLLLWASAALLLVHGAADLLRVSATR